MTRLATIAALALVWGCAAEPAVTYDVVIANGRVMDPESGLDAVRHVGIRSGTIEAIAETPLEGARVIDASGHVVAPGFIDLHQHGQHDEAYRLTVRDGVTSAFELEVGTADVDAWYAARRPRPGRRGRRLRERLHAWRDDGRDRASVSRRRRGWRFGTHPHAGRRAGPARDD
jgi:predicted amidohydrolase YtcJ